MRPKALEEEIANADRVQEERKTLRVEQSEHVLTQIVLMGRWEEYGSEGLIVSTLHPCLLVCACLRVSVFMIVFMRV